MELIRSLECCAFLRKASFRSERFLIFGSHFCVGLDAIEKGDDGDTCRMRINVSKRFIITSIEGQ